MTRDEFILKATEVLTDKLRYPLQKAIETATQLVDCIIEIHTNDLNTVMLDDLKICPYCQSGAWLLEHEDGDVTCFKCGNFFVAIELKGETDASSD